MKTHPDWATPPSRATEGKKTRPRPPCGGSSHRICDGQQGWMAEAASLGADLIVFPEVTLQQCPPWDEDNHAPLANEMAYMRDTAETVPGPARTNLWPKPRN